MWSVSVSSVRCCISFSALVDRYCAGFAARAREFISEGVFVSVSVFVFVSVSVFVFVLLCVIDKIGFRKHMSAHRSF